jgi:Two component regulator propeller
MSRIFPVLLSTALIFGQIAWAAETNPWENAEGNTIFPPASPGEPGYSVTRLTMEDGLPERTVTSLAQTPNGLLWCGTYSRLPRYDGARFKVFDPVHTPELDEPQIHELRCDAKGRPWPIRQQNRKLL